MSASKSILLCQVAHVDKNISGISGVDGDQDIT